MPVIISKSADYHLLDLLHFRRPSRRGPAYSVVGYWKPKLILKVLSIIPAEQAILPRIGVSFSSGFGFCIRLCLVLIPVSLLVRIMNHRW